MNVIDADGLGKRYRRTWAVRACRLAIPAGHVVALVGPNGAGKTTLLRILAGLMSPSAGRVTVLGHRPGTQPARDVVASVDQQVPLFRSLRVRGLLGAAQALNDRWDRHLVGSRLYDLGITPDRRVSKFSTGQQAQLALTLALARQPRLLLLDEPLANVDPLARQDVMGLLMTAVAEDGLSVVFSSHVVAELERIASYLVVLSNGQVQVAATVDSLPESHLALTGPAEEADRLAELVPIVTASRAGRQAYALVRTTDPPPGWPGRPATLEDVVLGYLREPAVRLANGLEVAR